MIESMVWLMPAKLMYAMSQRSHELQTIEQVAPDVHHSTPFGLTAPHSGVEHAGGDVGTLCTRVPETLDILESDSRRGFSCGIDHFHDDT